MLGTGGRIYYATYNIFAGPFGISIFGRWIALDDSGQAVAGGNFDDAVTYPPAVAASPQGQILWTRESPDHQTRSTMTVGGDGTLYIGAFDSKLYVVSDQDGSTQWSVGTYGTSYTPAVASDGTVYVTNFGGAISAYSPDGGAARPVLMSRDFNDRSLGGWTIVTDESVRSARHG
ncbi:MAG: PQQ-binding-like beta-propeller repeat protein [Pseudomonadota bacterium]|nr:PQQ-binding-like beta-propeller repeat protein [Pseudomonadota bacterium]